MALQWRRHAVAVVAVAVSCSFVALTHSHAQPLAAAAATVPTSHVAASAGRPVAVDGGAHADTVPLTVAYWAQAVKSQPGDTTAQACLALAQFRDADLDNAVPTLTTLAAHGRAPRAPPLTARDRREQTRADSDAVSASDDWVSLEHLGAAYNMMARKVASVPIEASGRRSAASLATQERAALLQAAGHFSRADAVRSRAMARGARSIDEYPQAAFAQDRTLVLRGWGDAVAWLKDPAEARHVFQKGVDEGLWRSPVCRPTDGVGVALARNMYFPEVPSAVASCHGDDGGGECRADGVVTWQDALPLAQLEAGLSIVRDELHEALDRDAGRDGDAGDGASEWVPEGAGLHVGRTWRVVVLWVDGEPRAEACTRWPRTCELIASMPAAARLNHGQVKLSRMAPGTVVRPHAGPTNARLRIHCALQVPQHSEGASGSDSGDVAHATARIRVGDQWRAWRDGECFAFDESCEHEVVISQDADRNRVVLIVDVANPFTVGGNVTHPDELGADIDGGAAAYARALTHTHPGDGDGGSDAALQRALEAYTAFQHRLADAAGGDVNATHQSEASNDMQCPSMNSD